MSWGPGNAASCPAWLHIASLVPYQLQPSTGVFRAESCKQKREILHSLCREGQGRPFPECAHHSRKGSGL